MKKLLGVLLFVLIASDALAQAPGSSATMEVNVTVISGLTVSSPEPALMEVVDKEFRTVSDAVFSVYTNEGVDFEVEVSRSSQLKNEFGDSLPIQFSSEKQIDEKNQAKNVIIRPYLVEKTQENYRGIFNGSVNTTIHYM